MSDIEDLIRRIAANEAERIIREHEQRKQHSPQSVSELVGVSKPLPPSLRCRARSRQGLRQCMRERGHGQRHRYGEPEKGASRPAFTPTNKWADIESIRIPGPTGVKTYEVRVGSPVKVKGFGRLNPDGSHAAQGDWWLSRIQRNTTLGGSGDLLECINVEVNRQGSHPRTVKADKLVYVKPTAKKLSARRGKVKS